MGGKQPDPKPNVKFSLGCYLYGRFFLKVIIFIAFNINLPYLWALLAQITSNPNWIAGNDFKVFLQSNSIGSSSEELFESFIIRLERVSSIFWLAEPITRSNSDEICPLSGANFVFLLSVSTFN